MAALLDDPYAAVRQVAGRELVASGALSPGEYDFLAEPRARLAVRDALLRRWGDARHRSASEVLHPGGELDYPRLQQELARRDNRPIMIAE